MKKGDRPFDDTVTATGSINSDGTMLHVVTLTLTKRGCTGVGYEDLCAGDSGATSSQAYCVYGDHCGCKDGFVCDGELSTITSAECTPGTGASVHLSLIHI